MKTVSLLVFISAWVASVAVAGDWEFTYSYQDVFATNADTYVVGRAHVKKYREWQDPPVTYWGPAANDVPALLTQRFDFPAPTSKVFLKARICGGDQGMHSGSASLWASRDGTSWQLLADSAAPGTNEGEVFSYNDDLPASLLGDTSLWLQVRMQAHGTLTTAYPDPRASWTDAQFGRKDSPELGNIFELDANFAHGLKAAIARLDITSRTVWWGVGSLVGLLLLLLAIWAFARKRRQERLYHQEILERLDAIDARLGTLERGPRP